jgi:hypothetical protein
MPVKPKRVQHPRLRQPSERFVARVADVAKPPRPVPAVCPCCQRPLEVLVRTIYEYRKTREVAQHVCLPCGVRVVLHRHPPRVTMNDHMYGHVNPDPA